MEFEKKVCPDCNGSGVYQEYDEYDRYTVHSCATCDGAGEIARQSVTSEDAFPSAIKWTGKNLREVIDLTGWNESASSKWTWAEYEQVVEEKGLKIFTPNGSVMAGIGDWIIYDGKDCYVTTQKKKSATSEEVQRAIKWAEKNIRELVKQLKDLAETKERYDYQIKKGEPWKWEWEKSWRALAVEQFQTEKKSAELAFTALQQMIPKEEQSTQSESQPCDVYELAVYKKLGITSERAYQLIEMEKSNNDI